MQKDLKRVAKEVGKAAERALSIQLLALPHVFKSLVPGGHSADDENIPSTTCLTSFWSLGGP
jgi:hypothetical protein